MDFKIISRGAANLAFIYGGAYIAYDLIVYITKANIFSPMTALANFLIILFLLTISLVISSRKLRDKYMGGYATYGEMLGSMLILGAFSGLLVGAYKYIHASFADITYLKEYAADFLKMLKDANVPAEDYNSAKENIKAIFDATPFQQAKGSFFLYLIFTLIVSLVAAIFIKKNRPLFEDTTVVNENED